MHKPVRKAILPVAGLGTRFLPATKAIPKEMLTVVDRPVIQYVVDEALAAGIEQLIFVTGRGKSVIEDYFDQAFELEATLSRRGKKRELKDVQSTQLRAGQAVFTRQQEPLGLGHAVGCARDIIGDEPFAVLLPDVIVLNQRGPGYMRQLVEAYEKMGGNLLAVEQVPQQDVSKYGIVALDRKSQGRLGAVRGMVEKPSIDTAQSNLAIVGRYILQPTIFEHLERIEAGAGGELQLTDAMLSQLASESYHSLICEGRTFDCGSKTGYLAATVACALSRADLAAEFKAMLSTTLTDLFHTVPPSPQETRLPREAKARIPSKAA